MADVWVNQTLRGALVGGAAGGVVGLGELEVLPVLELFPTDVQITGFAAIWAVPHGVAVGGVTAWRGWFDDWRAQAAGPRFLGLLAGLVAAWMPWASV